MTLNAECEGPAGGLADAVAANLQASTKLKGAVKIVAVGSLPNDGKVIADETATDADGRRSVTGPRCRTGAPFGEVRSTPMVPRAFTRRNEST